MVRGTGLARRAGRSVRTRQETRDQNGGSASETRKTRLWHQAWNELAVLVTHSAGHGLSLLRDEILVSRSETVKLRVSSSLLGGSPAQHHRQGEGQQLDLQ